MFAVIVYGSLPWITASFSPAGRGAASPTRITCTPLRWRAPVGANSLSAALDGRECGAVGVQQRRADRPRHQRRGGDRRLPVEFFRRYDHRAGNGGVH